jgi:hypothetical protein
MVVQEVNYDNPQPLHVFSYRWCGPEYNHGFQDEANSEEHRVLFCENSFVRGTYTWDWLVCRCVDRCTPQAR